MSQIPLEHNTGLGKNFSKYGGALCRRERRPLPIATPPHLAEVGDIPHSM
jgi:hypothetical protein